MGEWETEGGRVVTLQTDGDLNLGPFPWEEEEDTDQ